MDNATIARACYQAYVDKDRDAIERILAEDFHFTSPIDNRLDRATYFAHCWPNSAAIVGFDFVRVVGHGDQVFVTYVGSTTRARPFRNTEVLTIRGGKIVEVEVYFGWSIPHDAKEGSFVEAG